MCQFFSEFDTLMHELPGHPFIFCFKFGVEQCKLRQVFDPSSKGQLKTSFLRSFNISCFAHMVIPLGATSCIVDFPHRC